MSDSEKELLKEFQKASFREKEYLKQRFPDMKTIFEQYGFK